MATLSNKRLFMGPSIDTKKNTSGRSLYRQCHMCAYVIHTSEEVQRCPKCNKSFLPLNYFAKIHKGKQGEDYDALYSSCDELSEQEIIKGLYVIW